MSVPFRQCTKRRSKCSPGRISRSKRRSSTVRKKNRGPAAAPGKWKVHWWWSARDSAKLEGLQIRNSGAKEDRNESRARQAGDYSRCKADEIPTGFHKGEMKGTAMFAVVFHRHPMNRANGGHTQHPLRSQEFGPLRGGLVPQSYTAELNCGLERHSMFGLKGSRVSRRMLHEGCAFRRPRWLAVGWHRREARHFGTAREAAWSRARHRVPKARRRI